MKAKLLPLIALAMLLFSCKDVADPSPNLRIEGMYERNSEGNLGWGEGKFSFVDQLEFKSNGTVSGESYTTEIGSEEILGYRAYFLGTYSIEDGKVVISYDDSYHMGTADINYMPKEELTFYGETDFIMEYAVVEDYSELFEICPFNAACLEPVPYMRVD
ncbi:lipocalin family protein [Algoriphagus sp. NG3]|uniref:lipocalin family protein n=1 Tax=Algoriphagus sp. NG3 TaxID=3097546 RepID=UPI002A815242|nr:lipocalin family protein [Algoriphagus sp. NG3]WPR75833.1 lipocalin family protein [Algoriphagus sp. NG3]